MSVIAVCSTSIRTTHVHESVQLNANSPTTAVIRKAQLLTDQHCHCPMSLPIAITHCHRPLYLRNKHIKKSAQLFSETGSSVDGESIKSLTERSVRVHRNRERQCPQKQRGIKDSKETERRQRTCAEGSSSTRLRALNAKPISFLQLITIMCVVNGPMCNP